MQNNFYFKKLFQLSLIVAVAAGASASHAQGIKQTVMTVQDLLKIDDAQALAKAQSDAEKTGLLRPTEPKSSEKPKRIFDAPRSKAVSVEAIYGIGSDLRADISIDGVPVTGVRAGYSDGICQVTKIDGSGLQIAPVKKGAAICPKISLWTGLRVDPKENSANAGGTALQPVPIPLPVPMPQPIQSSVTAATKPAK